MSAQRRPTGNREPATRDGGIAGGPSSVATAPPAPRPSSRPPKPVVVERPANEPRSGFGARMDDLKRSYRDTVAEIKKVNWPDQETTKNLTIVVIGVSIVLGLLLGGVDFLLQTLFSIVP